MDIKKFFEKLFGKTEKNAHGTVQENDRKILENGAGAGMVCVDCKSSFIFPEGEQHFFKMRGLTPPKRCPSCRAKRKQRKNR